MRERKSRLVRSEVQPSLSEQAFVANRVRPFMDINRPLILLLSETYMQGMRDAVAVQGERA